MRQTFVSYISCETYLFYEKRGSIWKHRSFVVVSISLGSSQVKHSFLPWGQTLGTSLTRSVKPKLETSSFWCTQLKWGLQKGHGSTWGRGLRIRFWTGGCRDLPPTQLKKETHCCLGQRGRPFILIYLGKKKLRIGGKGVPRLNAWWLTSHHCCPGLSTGQRQYWSTGSKGWPPLSGHGNCEESVEIWLCATDMAGGFQILTHLWSLRAGQEIASLALRFHLGVAWASAPLQLKEELSFPLAVFGPPP
jgi:hypothetical protein